MCVICYEKTSTRPLASYSPRSKYKVIIARSFNALVGCPPSVSNSACSVLLGSTIPDYSLALKISMPSSQSRKVLLKLIFLVSFLFISIFASSSSSSSSSCKLLLRIADCPTGHIYSSYLAFPYITLLCALVTDTCPTSIFLYQISICPCLGCFTAP